MVSKRISRASKILIANNKDLKLFTAHLEMIYSGLLKSLQNRALSYELLGKYVLGLSLFRSAPRLASPKRFFLLRFFYLFIY